MLKKAGIVLVWGWSLSHLLGGTATTENLALVLVLPLAWTFGYWGVVGPLFVAWRIQRLPGLVESVAERRAAGAPPSPEQAQELEDTLVNLAAEENHLPERLVRPFVRKLLTRIGREEAAGPDAAATR